MLVTIVTVKDSEKVTFHDFGLFDSKGREHGIYVKTFKEQYVEYVEGDHWWNTSNCGTPVGTIVYKVRTQATKNGETWGASQGSRIFNTEAEMMAYIEKRIAQSKKAAAKKK